MRSALFYTWAPAPQNVCARPCIYGIHNTEQMEKKLMNLKRYFPQTFKFCH